MNPVFVNKYLPFRVQDSKDTVLLFFCLLLPLTALLNHAHLWCACLLTLVLCLGIAIHGINRSVFSGTGALFLLFLSLSLSGIVLPCARHSTLLTLVLRLSFFLPFIFRKRKAQLLRYYADVGAFVGGLSFVGLLLGRGVLGYTDTSRFPTLARAAGLFGNPNVLAAYLLPAALLSLYALLYASEKKLRHLFPFALTTLGILGSFSRGAAVALLASAFLLLCRRFRPSYVIAVTIALLPLVTLLLPTALTDRLFSLLSPDSSVSYRFSLWQSIFRLPPRTLFFGVGEGRKAMLTALSPVLAAGLTHIEHTHSLFFHLLLAHGVLGLLLVLILAIKSFFSGEDGCPYAILALFLFGIFDDPLYSGQTEVIFWLLLGASLEGASFSFVRSHFFSRLFSQRAPKRQKKPHPTSSIPLFSK